MRRWGPRRSERTDVQRPAAKLHGSSVALGFRAVPSPLRAALAALPIAGAGLLVAAEFSTLYDVRVVTAVPAGGASRRPASRLRAGRDRGRDRRDDAGRGAGRIAPRGGRRAGARGGGAGDRAGGRPSRRARDGPDRPHLRLRAGRAARGPLPRARRRLRRAARRRAHPCGSTSRTAPVAKSKNSRRTRDARQRAADPHIPRRSSSSPRFRARRARRSPNGRRSRPRRRRACRARAAASAPCRPRPARRRCAAPSRPRARGRGRRAGRRASPCRSPRRAAARARAAGRRRGPAPGSAAAAGSAARRPGGLGARPKGAQLSRPATADGRHARGRARQR